MSQMDQRDAKGVRSSALWGTGGRGGDRSSVLWGKGGRGIVLASIAAVALAAPLAAMASPGKPATAPAPPDASDGKHRSTWVDKGLLNQAKTTPDNKISVIITSTGGTDGANRVYDWLSKMAAKQSDVTGGQDLDLVGGITATLPARLVAKLSTVSGITVTPDAPVQISGYGGYGYNQTNLSSTQLWPYETGNADMWAGDQLFYAGKLPAIAVVDSGIQNRPDFGNRVIASVNLSTLNGNASLNDERGHGTFVAGIAAGAGLGLTGAAPTAPLVSIKVMDSNGMAKTSDVINACAWILAHKNQYNIRVANFSLHSSYGTNSYRDPLDRAVEKLWFNGVTVVAASGNYGTSDSSASGVTFAPGNDPFVITVGAVDLHGTTTTRDDTVAPWSAWGYTEDGFFKPELTAPGRYVVGPIPAGSTIAQEKAASLVGSDRIQLSGTSFAAPVVSGTVAQMLARNPSWTPDQVKGALMKTARSIAGNKPAGGIGELTASRAAATVNPPNPNAALDQFVKQVTTNGGTGYVFDAQSWASAAKASMSWADKSWTDMSWTDMSWADQSWSDMSWAEMSWAEMSWTDMSWTDMSWTDMSAEDAAEGDGLSGTAGYVATPDQLAAAAADPDQVNVDGLAAAPPAQPTTATASSTTTAPATTPTTSSTTTSAGSGTTTTTTSSGSTGGGAGTSTALPAGS